MSSDFNYDGDQDFLPKINELGNKFEFFEEIKDKGANSVVLRGRNKLLNRDIVLKFYYWQKGTYVEPQRLSAFDHPNILRVYDAEPIDDNHAYYVTEYCENGDLDDLISAGGLSVHGALDILRQVALGVAELHSASLVHRDLKPQNIYLDGAGVARIGDFGSIIDLGPDETKESHTKHSLLYRPPEAFDNTYCRQSDLYQLGLLGFQLLGGQLCYDLTSYLGPLDLKTYQALDNDWDRSSLVDNVVSRRVNKQKLVDLGSLPPWAQNKRIKRLIKKAMSPQIGNRHESVSDFLSDLAAVRADCLDWKPDAEGIEVCLTPTSYRILKLSPATVLKRRDGAEWRQDHSIKGLSFESAIERVGMQV